MALSDYTYGKERFDNETARRKNQDSITEGYSVSNPEKLVWLRPITMVPAVPALHVGQFRFWVRLFMRLPLDCTDISLVPDGLHLNDTSHAIMAKVIAEELLKLYEREGFEMIRTEYRTGYEFSFVAYTGVEVGEKRPLIIQLHGAGERGNGNEELVLVDKNGFSKYLNDTEHDCVVVMPQCPKDSFWAARVESIVRFVHQMIEKFNADPNRVYLTGLSMGGYGTWFTAMAYPELFAAIAPVCGGGMAWNAAVLTMPIWTCHGVEDDTVSINQTEEMVAKLRALGKDVTYERLEGYGHNVWDYAYTERLLEWLLSKKS